MVSDNLRIDELILQVFEEHEDVFFWPVHSQKDAKTFVKYMHDKGAPYEDIGKEIGEFEHNFSAWRKGLGRVGIGSRMLERINRTVEDVILSDGDDDADHNLKLLSKINQKKDTQPKEKESPVKVNGEKKLVEPKQQKANITKSMMQNIDKVTEQKQISKDTDKPRPTAAMAAPGKSDSAQQKPMETTTKPDVKLTTTVTTEQKRSSEEKLPVERKKSPIPVASKEESKKEEMVVKAEVKTELKNEPITKPEVPKIEVQSQENEPKPLEPEIDEVKKKMDALKKKVELMKKAKQEAAAKQQSQSQTTDPVAPSNEPNTKLDAVKKKISDLRNRAKEYQTEAKSTQESENPEQSTSEDESPSTLEVPVTSPPIVRAEEATEEDDETSSEASEATDSSDLEEDDEFEGQTPIYFSDLDPDNYDSDLEFEMNGRAKKLSADVTRLHTEVRRQDSAGHIFLFSDSPAGETRTHRVMIGATRNPEKKFAEARRYNIALKRVSTVAVSKRHSALRATCKVLRKYQIEGEKDWFQGPIDVLLQCVSEATEKFGSGPALVRFSSKC